MPGHAIRATAAYAEATASAIVWPRAVTPSTRPPSVTTRPFSRRVAAWNRAELGEPGDRPAALHGARVALGGEHDAGRRPGIPRHRLVRQRAFAGRVHQRRQVRGEAQHQDLRLGVAEPDVELEDLGVALVHHETGVEDTGVADALASQPEHQRLHDV